MKLQTVLKEQDLIGGIGRELYTAPLIRIWLSDKDGKENYSRATKQDGKFTTYTKFYVEKIEIIDKKITGLAIKNNEGKRVFVYVKPKKEAE